MKPDIGKHVFELGASLMRAQAEQVKAVAMCELCGQRAATTDSCGRQIDVCLVCDENRNRLRGDYREDRESHGR